MIWCLYMITHELSFVANCHYDKIKNKNIMIYLWSHLSDSVAVWPYWGEGGGVKNKKCRYSLSWQVPFLGSPPTLHF